MEKATTRKVAILLIIICCEHIDKANENTKREAVALNEVGKKFGDTT